MDDFTKVGDLPEWRSFLFSEIIWPKIFGRPTTHKMAHAFTVIADVRAGHEQIELSPILRDDEFDDRFDDNFRVLIAVPGFFRGPNMKDVAFTVYSRLSVSINREVGWTPPAGPPAVWPERPFKLDPESAFQLPTEGVFDTGPYHCRPWQVVPGFIINP